MSNASQTNQTPTPERTKTVLPPINQHQARRRRAPVRTDHKRPPTERELDWSIAILDQLGELPDAIAFAIQEHLGRPASVKARHILLAFALNATETNHQAEFTDAAAQLVALTPSQRARMDLPQLATKGFYKRFHDKATRVRDVLEQGFSYTDSNGRLVYVDLDIFVNLLVDASVAIESDMPLSRTSAVDGTDWESCAQFRVNKQQLTALEYDGDVLLDLDGDADEQVAQILKNRETIDQEIERRVAEGKMHPLRGQDGRVAYTNDPDARVGHRGATGSRAAGFYNGAELHIEVQVPDYGYDGKVTRVNEGQAVPHLIRSAVHRPAGSHRGNAVLPVLLDNCERLETLALDRGYTSLPFGKLLGPLARVKIAATFDLTESQRARVQVSAGVLWIDGAPFHLNTPEKYHHLERPNFYADADKAEAYTKRFNERARWAYVRHTKPDADGYAYFMCPFCAGKLRCRNFDQKKVAQSAPLEVLPEDVTECCSGLVQFDAEQLQLMQAGHVLYGTTAHWHAYRRRLRVETGNSYLGGGFVQLDRAYARAMGDKNRKFFLGFLLAGLNRYIAHQWRQKVGPNAKKVKVRGKSRPNTLDKIIERATASGPTRPQNADKRPRTTPLIS